MITDVTQNTGDSFPGRALAVGFTQTVKIAQSKTDKTMKNTEMKESINKNEYEERIKKFADDLEEKIQALNKKKNEVEESARTCTNPKSGF